MVSFNVKDSVAFVTGTNRPNGIGRAIVEALLKAGAKKVYATARKPADMQDFIDAQEGKVVPVALDLNDLEACKIMGETYPDVNLLVSNAGYFEGGLGTWDESRLAEIAQTEIQVNYIAPMILAKGFSSKFEKISNTDDDGVRGSAIVEINSIASFVSFPPAPTYSSSKAAMHIQTLTLRRNLPETLVIGVYPGPIDTDMQKTLDFPMAKPMVVADAVVKALEDGTEDVFPDDMAASIYQGLRTDPKAVEYSLNGRENPSPPLSTQEVLDRHLAAFGKGDVAGIVVDYADNAIVIVPDNVFKGTEAIQAAFQGLFDGPFKPGTYEGFELTGMTVEGETAYINWKIAKSEVLGSVQLGTDSFVVRDGKIVTQTFSMLTGN